MPDFTQSYIGAHGTAGGLDAVEQALQKILAQKMLEAKIAEEQRRYETERGDVDRDFGLRERAFESGEQTRREAAEALKSDRAATQADREADNLRASLEQLPMGTELGEDEAHAYEKAPPGFFDAKPAFQPEGPGQTASGLAPMFPARKVFRGTQGQRDKEADNARQQAELERQRGRDEETERANRERERIALINAGRGSGADDLATFEEKERIKAKYSGARGSIGQERSALAFLNRARDADATLTESGLEDRIATQRTMGQLQGQYAPNLLQTKEQQAYRQAQRTFTEARLRKESGAAVPESEYANDARAYFAQPGDAPEIVAQKRQARQVVLDGLAMQAGRAYEEYYGEPYKPRGIKGSSSPAPATTPTTLDELKQMLPPGAVIRKKTP